MPEERTCGRMIIDLIDTGDGPPYPRVSFSPVGRWTPGLLDRHLLTFAREIQRAQVEVRREATLAPTTPVKRSTK